MSQINKSTRSKTPMLLSHVFRHCLWGGNRLIGTYTEGVLGHSEPLAELWLCSTYPGYESRIESGDYKGMTLSELLSNQPEIIGSKYKHLKDIPILIKIIDAKEHLSLQVHPDDDYARENEDEMMGKTELWYVLSAEEGSVVTHGLLHDTDREELRSWVESGELERHLRKVKVRKGDALLIDSGTVHGINAGPIIAEVQENSNLTYRIWDYDRRDESGNLRELHIDKALDVVNCHRCSDIRRPMRQLKYVPGFSDELMGRCRYFELHRVMINTDGLSDQNDEQRFVPFKTTKESFEVLLCIDGRAKLSWDDGSISLERGRCTFIPADSREIHISGKATMLRVLC